MQDATKLLLEKRNRNLFSALSMLFPAGLLVHTLFALKNFDAFSIGLGLFSLAVVLGALWFQLRGAWNDDYLLNHLSRRSTTEDRLDELERLKRRDMVTPEEYAAKRQEILKDL